MTAGPLLRAHADPLADLPVAFDYDHLSLVPRVASTLSHRSDASPQVAMGPLLLRLPLLAAPDARRLRAAHVPRARRRRRARRAAPLPVGRRAGRRLQRLRTTARRPPSAPPSASPVTTGTASSACTARAAGSSASTPPTARTSRSAPRVEWIRGQADDVFVIAGNVATAEAFRWLEDRGADAIRVGIAGGSVCETRTETAVYAPTPHAVAEAAQVRRRALIIGDSGVRTPADMCKLLALGADLVMVGSALAGTREAPGRVIVVDGKKVKIMRGAASFSVQQQAGHRGPRLRRGDRDAGAVQGWRRRRRPALPRRAAQLDVVHGRAHARRVPPERQLHRPALSASRRRLRSAASTATIAAASSQNTPSAPLRSVRAAAPPPRAPQPKSSSPESWTSAGARRRARAVVQVERVDTGVAQDGAAARDARTAEHQRREHEAHVGVAAAPLRERVDAPVRQPQPRRVAVGAGGGHHLARRLAGAAMSSATSRSGPQARYTSSRVGTCAGSWSRRRLAHRAAQPGHDAGVDEHGDAVGGQRDVALHPGRAERARLHEGGERVLEAAVLGSAAVREPDRQVRRREAHGGASGRWHRPNGTRSARLGHRRERRARPRRLCG